MCTQPTPTGFKSVGLNLNGVPTDAANRPVLSAAAVKPEDTRNVEFGLKSEPFSGADRQPDGLQHRHQELPGAGHQRQRGRDPRLPGERREGPRARGRVRRQRPARRASFPSTAPPPLTDGKYVRFVDAPPALKNTGGPQSQDISGTVLPGISRWATTFGAEYGHRARLAGVDGQLFGALDTSYRSWFSSSATYSHYLLVDGYSLLNARVGFRAAGGWTVTFWSRNVLNKDYYELLTAAPATPVSMSASPAIRARWG